MLPLSSLHYILLYVLGLALACMLSWCAAGLMGAQGALTAALRAQLPALQVSNLPQPSTALLLWPPLHCHSLDSSRRFVPVYNFDNNAFLPMSAKQAEANDVIRYRLWLSTYSLCDHCALQDFWKSTQVRLKRAHGTARSGTYLSILTHLCRHSRTTAA